MTYLVDTTLGALLLGGFCAAALVPVLATLTRDLRPTLFQSSLSGVAVVQTLIYIKLFPGDSARVKAIVSF